jgi:branched-chain amino acid transport system substrate-binding protein
MGELLERGISFPVIAGVANGAFSLQKFLDEFGDRADGLIDLNYRYNPKSERADHLHQAYREKYGDELPVHAVYGYESIYVLADALERAASTDRDAIRDALAATSLADHVLPHGPIEFDEKGENKNAAGVLIQVQNGKHVIVYPQEYAEAEYIPAR